MVLSLDPLAKDPSLSSSNAAIKDKWPDRVSKSLLLYKLEILIVLSYDPLAKFPFLRYFTMYVILWTTIVSNKLNEKKLKSLKYFWKKK